MKNTLSATFFISFVFVLFQVQKTQAQADSSKYDLQFGNPTYTQTPPTFCTTLQIRATNGYQDFGIGSHTFFFSYNRNAINNPTYTSINFSNTNLCFNNIAPYDIANFVADINTGEANVSTLMNQPPNACPIITQNEWTDIGEVCFEVFNTFLPLNLIFDTAYTDCNTSSDVFWVQHKHGTFEPFTESIDILTYQQNTFFEQKKIQIFPNFFTPNTPNTVHISKTPTLLHAQLSACNGNIISTQKNIENQFVIPQNLPAGIYFLQLYNGNTGAMLKTEKIIIF